MANKYLNDTGLQYFYNKLKTVFQAKESGKGLSTNDYTTAEKNKLAGISAGAEVNQNAFSIVNITNDGQSGGTSLSADSKTASFGIRGGTGVTITPAPDSNNITITAIGSENQNAFSEIVVKEKPSDLPAAYKTITAAQESSQFSLLASDNMTLTVTENGVLFKATNTTYSAMSQSEATTGTSTTARTITAKVLATTIANAIAGVTQISYSIVSSLPATGQTGVIYLVAHSHGTGDGYDEYIWLGSAYEKIGNTDVDLSGYLKKTDMVAITTSEIDSLFA